MLSGDTRHTRRQCGTGGGEVSPWPQCTTKIEGFPIRYKGPGPSSWLDYSAFAARFFCLLLSQQVFVHVAVTTTMYMCCCYRYVFFPCCCQRTSFYMLLSQPLFYMLVGWCCQGAGLLLELVGCLPGERFVSDSPGILHRSSAQWFKQCHCHRGRSIAILGYLKGQTYLAEHACLKKLHGAGLHVD